MEFKGTKGEWKMSDINIPDYKSICVFSDGEEQKVLLHIYLPNYEITEEELSNAKLIASAPDLLEALTMLIEETEDYVNETACGNTYLDIAREKARKAIEKALK